MARRRITTAGRKATAQKKQDAQQARHRARDIKIEWHGERMQKIMRAKFSTRLKAVSQLIRDQMVRNVSRPVLKYKGIRSNRIQVDPESRSKPGEFPKAETTLLMKNIFWHVDKKGQEGFVYFPGSAIKAGKGPKAGIGTPLGYALILETEMDRSFLRRTLEEMQPVIRKILTAKMGLK